VASAQDGRSTSKRAVDRDDLNVRGIQEGVYLGVCVQTQRTNENLRVHAGAYMDLMLVRQPGAGNGNCPLVLHVGGVEEADEHIGIENY
jgi:hypothetical protein